MGYLAWALVAIGVVAVAVAVRGFQPTLFPADRRREVLPAYYSSLVWFDPVNYPGHCPACGTDNEPGYRFCESCGSEIPTSDWDHRDVDLSTIFDT